MDTPGTMRKRSISNPRGLPLPAVPSIQDRTLQLPDPVVELFSSIKSRIGQSEESKLTQAFYNSAANAILVILAAAGVALWFVFQSFFEPLFWAVLCGAFLHPFKTKCVRTIEKWLDSLTDDNIPLLVGVFILFLSIPLFIVKFISSSPHRILILGGAIVANIAIQTYGGEDLVFAAIDFLNSIYHAISVVIVVVLNSGSNVEPISNRISALVFVVLIVLLLLTIKFDYVSERVSTISFLLKWVLWILLSIKIYPIAVLNRTMLFSTFSILTLTIYGLFHRSAVNEAKERKRSLAPDDKKGKSNQKSPSKLKPSHDKKENKNAKKEKGKEEKKKETPISTEICTTLIILCILTVTEVIQIIVVLGIILSLSGIVYSIKSFFKYLREKDILSSFVPKELLFVWDCFEIGDKMFVNWLKRQLNLIVSILIIVFVIAAFTTLVIFFSFQLYNEGTKLAHSGWENRVVAFDFFSISSDIEWDHSFEVAKNFTREQAEKWAKELTGEDIRLDNLGLQITALWESTKSPTQLEVPTEMVIDFFNSWDFAAFWDAYGSNVRVVLEAIWGQIVTNIKLIGWIVAQGMGIFNFVFSLLLFITALFYLIGTSNDESYKPMNWLVFYFPDELRKIAIDSINEAVSQVFKTTFKLALFHSLFTWLSYSLFGCSVVFFPTLISAVMASVPLLPTYFDCLPGVIELWLVASPVKAFLLFLLHLAASWWIDPLVYSEIKSSHHYITGLSVVGGLYFFGLQGVIIGPMLVCALLIISKLMADLRNASGKPKAD